MKGWRTLFIPILLLLCLFLIIPSPANAGMQEDNSEIKKELSEIKKELEEIKRLIMSQSQAPFRPPTPQVSEASIDDDPILGDKGAPITLIEFSDYQCPFCRRFYKETLPRLKDEFIKKGKLRYVFRDFPVQPIHPFANKAAEAAQCAEEEGQYWEMHDLLFENQEAMETENIKAHAKALGLNLVAFEKCLEEGKYVGEVDKDKNAGLSAGIRGTPSFILGPTTSDGKIRGTLIVGAQPYEVFRAAIQDLLNNP